MKLVAFDLETTGLDRHRDRIIEFSFVELDPDLVEKGRWSRLVDPGIPIPAEIEALTGIRNDMVQGLPRFASHAPRIQALVRDAVLIAHNYAFDLPFLDAHLRAAGQPGLAADHPCIDTLVIERYVNSNRLADTYHRYTGQAPDSGHRSEADVLATVEVLRRQRERHKDRLPGAGLDDLLYTRVDGHFGGAQRVRHWLDHDHRFYRDPEGTLRFGFGPHRGCPAIQAHTCTMGGVGTHEEFLRWMLRRDFPADTKATVEMVLRAKASSPPSPASRPGEGQATGPLPGPAPSGPSPPSPASDT